MCTRQFQVITLACALLVPLSSGLMQAQPAGQASLPGLVAACKDSRHSIQMVTPSPSFLLEASESIHPSLEPSFECEWRGSVEILRAGSYQFDRGTARVWIGSEEIGDQPQPLTAGTHPLRVSYAREPGLARVRLQWKSENFAWEPLPSTSLTHAASEEPSTEQLLATRGRWLVEDYGCLNCHNAPSSAVEQRRAPSLTAIGSRIQSGWLHRWLDDPKAHRADARMPRMLDAGQRRDVATYLSTLNAGSARSDAATPANEDSNQGAMLVGALGCSACHGDSGVSLEGLGSKFQQGGLVEYLIEPAKFEPSGRMPSMLLNEREATLLAAHLLQSKNPAAGNPPAPGDAGRGKQLVETSGCLACHELNAPEALSNKLAAPAWNSLKPGRGCLSESAAETPRYGLSAQERQAIEAFLANSQQHPDVSEAPVFALRRALDRLQCGSCHTIDHAPPPAGLREAPPPLTGAGAKLRTAWFEGVLTGYNRALDWFELRMPHYEREQVQDLIAGFGKAAGVEPDRGFSGLVADETARERGHGLLGTNPAKGGMACIGCHDWGENKALGEHGPQLVNAAQRLREDWFHRWMLDPTRILSGTSMPNYFTSTPPEQADETITALWAALLKGGDQPAPDGFEQTAENDPEAKPVPTDTPIVIRWDMPEATPAAIAVGMPGELSYCFDAGETRLRYAWHGGFIDLSGTLLSKRDPETQLSYTAALVGDIFFRSASFPIRVGRLEEIPRRQFRGYRLIDGFPEFHYTVEGIDVREKIIQAQGAVGIVREFRFDVVDQPVWLLPEAAEGVEITSSVAATEPGPIVVPQGQDVTVRITVLQRN
jgi:cbb3-type cytochrome oxidase cytochrome c subunit